MWVPPEKNKKKNNKSTSSRISTKLGHATSESKNLHLFTIAQDISYNTTLHSFNMPNTNNNLPGCGGCCSNSETKVEEESTCRKKCQKKSSNETTKTLSSNKSSCCDGQFSSAAIAPHDPDLFADESKTAVSCRGNETVDDCCSPQSPAAKSCCISSKSTSKNDCCGTSAHMDGDTKKQNWCADSDSFNGAETIESCCNVTIRLSPQSDFCGQTIEKTLICQAVIRRHDSAVEIFDTEGRSRIFCVSSKRKHLPARKLCFSNHGAGNGIDGMLTPCFDENGKHDACGCPCGVDELHLHARIYDPKVCGIDDCADCVSSAARTKATDWKFLSQLTLLLVNGKEESSYFPITDNVPKECNSVALNNHLVERGLTQSQWYHHWRSGTKKYMKECGINCTSRQVYPVKHEDHINFLIHNEMEMPLDLNEFKLFFTLHNIIHRLSIHLSFR